MRYLHEHVAFDCFVVLGYPESGELIVFHDGDPERKRLSCTSTYREGMWLFSPLYLSARQGTRGFFQISDVIGPSFKSSEFYAKYYSPLGIKDHVGYIAENARGKTVAISIERSEALPLFSSAEKEFLKTLEPLVTSLVRKNWPTFSPTESTTSNVGAANFREALTLLGVEALTPREEDVLMALLRGLPNKLIARELAISAETVKVYCKQINRKLDVNTRSELFARVLQLILS